MIYLRIQTQTDICPATGRDTDDVMENVEDRVKALNNTFTNCSKQAINMFQFRILSTEAKGVNTHILN